MTVFYVVFMYHIVLTDMGLLALHDSVLCGIHVSNSGGGGGGVVVSTPSRA